VLALIFKGDVMAASRQKSTGRARNATGRNALSYRDQDDHYFRKHFARLVREHGGKWVVLANGKLIGIGKKNKIRGLVLKAQENYPDSTPFIAPIPTQEELECVL
jgi:type I restriction-modification system DNA methylase subunit